MKKFWATLIILALAGTAIFFIGWVQFWVPAGNYGVLVSKTGGVNPQTIEPAKFRWQWERLLPTNSRIVIFDLAPVSRPVSVTGSLPSADIYRTMLEGSPDFSWKLDFTVTSRIDPQTLPLLVEKNAVHDQASLASLADTSLSRMAYEAGNSLVSEFSRDPSLFRASGTDRSALAKRVMELIATGNVKGIEVVAVDVSNARFPDFALYDLAAKTYADYQGRRATTMAETAKKQARDSIADYLEIERFSALGEVLTKYPILIDYLAVTKEGSLDAFKVIRSRP